MLEKLKLVEARYLEMAERAAQPDFYNDPKAASQLLKEQRQLEPIITAYRSYMKTTQEQDDLRAMLSEGLDPEMKALCQEEFSANKKKLEELEQELKILLLPRDPNDDKSVIMEIRGGVGGEESALFAHSLYRMYTMYAQSKGWKVTLLNYNETELGGVRLFLTHGHLFGVKSGMSRLKLEADRVGADIALFGHTHRPFLEEDGGVWYMNPGAARDGHYGVIEMKDGAFTCELKELPE